LSSATFEPFSLRTPSMLTPAARCSGHGSLLHFVCDGPGACPCRSITASCRLDAHCTHRPLPRGTVDGMERLEFPRPGNSTKRSMTLPMAEKPCIAPGLARAPLRRSQARAGRHRTPTKKKRRPSAPYELRNKTLSAASALWRLLCRTGDTRGGRLSMAGRPSARRPLPETGQ
jgi:hypothetical protein